MMFEDEEFDLCLDFPDNPKKSSNPEKSIHGFEKDISYERNVSENGANGEVLNHGVSRSMKEQLLTRQKSIFSLNDTSESESEILDISLGLDGWKKVEESRDILDALDGRNEAVMVSPSQSEFRFKLPGTVSSSLVTDNAAVILKSHEKVAPKNVATNLTSANKNMPNGNKALQNKNVPSDSILGKRGQEEQTNQQPLRSEFLTKRLIIPNTETELSRLVGDSSRKDPGLSGQKDQQSESAALTGFPFSDKTFESGAKRAADQGKEKHRNVLQKENPPKRRFPGPAGILPRLAPGNLALVVDEDENEEQTEPAVPDLQCSQENVDENTVWTKALGDLGMRWGDPDCLVSKYNVGLIKRNAAPGSSIRMPILVARIKNLDTSCLDPICRLSDPVGEVGGSIHRDVIEQFGAEIQVGSILVLRNVIVLMTAKTQYVNITANNLVSIYRSDNVAHIHRVNLKDMEQAAVELEKVRQEQLRLIKEGSDQNQQVVNPQNHQPAFSVPGQQNGRIAGNLQSPQQHNLPNKNYRKQQQSLPNDNCQGPQQQTVSNNGYQGLEILPNNSYQGQQQTFSDKGYRQQQKLLNNSQEQQNLPKNNCEGRQQNVSNNGYSRQQNNGNPQQSSNNNQKPNWLASTYKYPTLATKSPQQQINNLCSSSLSTIGSTQSNLTNVSATSSTSDGFRLPATPQQSTSKFVFRSKVSPTKLVSSVTNIEKPLSNTANITKPFTNSTNISRSNQLQDGCFSSSQVLQKIDECFRAQTSQPTNIPESSQNLIDSMMEGLDTDSLFGDF